MLCSEAFVCLLLCFGAAIAFSRNTKGNKDTMVLAERIKAQLFKKQKYQERAVTVTNRQEAVTIQQEPEKQPDSGLDTFYKQNVMLPLINIISDAYYDGATSITVDSKGEIHSDKGKNYHIDLGVIPLSFISKQYYNNNSLSGNCVTIAVTAFGENLED
ncbi:MAG: hypothetical protein ACI4HK_05740 [Ruminococcus sp.]